MDFSELAASVDAEMERQNGRNCGTCNICGFDREAGILCAWRHGWFPADFRPDSCGVLAMPELTEEGRTVMLATSVVDDSELERALLLLRGAMMVTVLSDRLEPGARIDVHYPDGSVELDAGRVPENPVDPHPVEIDDAKLQASLPSTPVALRMSKLRTEGVG